MNAAVEGLRPESRTLLIPLAGRVHASAVAPRSGFSDPLAERFAELLQLDLKSFAEDRGIARGSVRRARVFDRVAQDFLSRHPGARVLNLGAGLCTRYSRVSGAGEWLEIDLPEVLALRRKLEAETDSHRFVALDCNSAQAAGTLQPLFTKTTLVIAEGVLMFLQPAAVSALFATLASATGRRAFVFDYLHPLTQRIAPRLNRSLRATGSRYHWSVRGLSRWLTAFAELRVSQDGLYDPSFAGTLIDGAARAVFGGSLYNVALVEDR